MSEGQVFFSLVPNITMHLPGVRPVTFKNGRFPGRKNEVCTDPQIIAALKGCQEYPRTIISEEDKIARDAPDPKVTKDLVEKALKVLKEIPGVTPSEPIQLKPQDESLKESQEQSTEPSAQGPSLTEITRMKKDDLMDVSESLGLSLNESDTVAILRRRLRSAIRQID